MSSINTNVTLTQALRAATSRHGWVGALVFPFALLRTLFN